MEYLSRFNYQMMYVERPQNKVADCLSQYYANNHDNEHHSYDDYVQVDIQLDLEGEELSTDQLAKLCSMRLKEARTSGINPLLEENLIHT